MGPHVVEKLIEDQQKIRSLEHSLASLPENLKAGTRANLAASKEALDGTQQDPVGPIFDFQIGPWQPAVPLANVLAGDESFLSVAQ